MATTINYNGTEIKIGSQRQGEKDWNGYPKQYHRISLTINGNKVTFGYYCNDAKLNDNDKICALYCFVSDCISYANARDMQDFANEFGYDDYKELNKIWKGIKREYEKWQSITDIDILDFSNYLTDNYEV